MIKKRCDNMITEEEQKRLARKQHIKQLQEREVINCCFINAVRQNSKAYYRNAENQIFKAKIGMLRVDNVKVKTKVYLSKDDYTNKKFYSKWIKQKRQIGINIYGKVSDNKDAENGHKSKDQYVYFSKRGIR